MLAILFTDPSAQRTIVVGYIILYYLLLTILYAENIIKIPISTSVVRSRLGMYFDFSS